MTQRPTSYILLSEMVEEEDGQFAAYCPELGTASCGDTLDEAISNLREANTVHLDALREVGTLKQVLKERDIIVYPMTLPVEQWYTPLAELANKIVTPTTV